MNNDKELCERLLGDLGILWSIRTEAAARIEALQAENAELRKAKWEVKHTDTMNDMVALGLARDALQARVEELEGAAMRLRACICEIVEARDEEDFERIIAAIDDAKDEATLSALGAKP